MKKQVFLLWFFSLGIVSLLKAQGDDCSNAVQLTNLANYCSSGATYSNEPSTKSKFGNADCWSGSISNDVWFKFICVGSEVMITVNGEGTTSGGTLNSPNLALYTGDCAGTIIQEACKAGAYSSNSTNLFKAGLVLGKTYLIRISTASSNTGKFDLCINNFTPTPNPKDPNDCDKATIVCNKDAVSVGVLTGSGNNTSEHKMGCFSSSNEAKSSWLHFKCKESGSLLFDINGSNPTDDIDWLLMEISDLNNCATKNLISCNVANCEVSTTDNARLTGLRDNETDASKNDGTDVTPNSEPGGCISTANGYNQSINIVQGKTYALFLNNFTADGGFSVKWAGTSKFVGPEAEITADKTSICVGESINVNGNSSLAYTSMSWVIPDVASPTSSTGPNPFSITFNKTGQYPVILSAKDNNGCSSVKNKMITVNGVNPDFSANAACASSPMTFTNKTVGASACTWDFGDGTPAGNGTNTSHTYPNSGTFNVKMTATASGCNSSITKPVSVLGANLNILNANTQFCPGLTLTLEGTAAVSGNVNKALPFTGAGPATIPRSKVNPYNWDGSVGSGFGSEPATEVGLLKIPVSGVGATNWKLNKVCLSITTKDPGEIVAYLENPCGKRIKLIENISSNYTGTPAENFTNTCFTDIATNVLGTTGNKTAPSTGTFAAKENSKWTTNLLNCADPNGDWKLIVGDAYSGTSNSNIKIENCTVEFQADGPNTIKSLTWSPLTNLTALADSGIATPFGKVKADISVTDSISLIAIDQGGCTSTKKIKVTAAAPEKPIANDKEICINTPAKLTASGAPGASFNWFAQGDTASPLPNTTVPDSIFITSALMPVLSSDTSFWVSQMAGGCESFKKEVKIKTSTDIKPIFDSIDTICSGASLPPLPLTSKNGITGSWAPAFDSTATTDYIFTPDPNQCAVNDTLTIVVKQKTIPSFTPVADICKGGVLNDLPTSSTNTPTPITGAWSPAINNTDTTTYTFTPSPGQCATSDSITINVNDKITPKITCGTSTTNSVQFDWEAITGATGYDISYSIGGGSAVTVSGITSLNYTVTGLNEGENADLKVTPLGASCFDSETQSCKAKTCIPPTIISQPKDTARCNGDSVIFTVNYSGGIKVQWQIFNSGKWVDLSDNTKYSGATTASLKINNVNGLHGKKYQMIIFEPIGSCPDTTAPFTLSVYAPPSISVIHKDQPCPALKGSVTLNPTGGSGTSSWQYKQDNLNFVLTNNFDTLYPKTHLFTVRDPISGCTKDTSIFIIAADQFTVRIPDTLCKGDTIKLIASGVNPFKWNLGSATTDSTFSKMLDVPTLITVSDSCNPAGIQKTVQLYPDPVLSIATDTSMCLGDTAKLSAKISGGRWPFIFTWSPIDDLTNVKHASLSTMASFVPLIEKKYSYLISVTDNCRAKDTKTKNILVNPKPNVEIWSEDAVCQNDTLTLYNIKHNNSMTKYEWNIGAISDRSIGKTLQSFATPGIYFASVKVTDANNCTNTSRDTFEVIKNPVPIIIPSATEKSINNPIILFNGSESHDNISKYKWDFAKLDIDTLDRTSFTFPDTGVYPITLNLRNTNIIKGKKYYCYDSATVSITIFDEITLFIPNTFTPNNDGQNDFFSPKGFGFSKYEIRVFDRWGQLVYYSDDIEKPWDGTIEGSKDKSNQDTYVYLINVEPNNKNAKNKAFTGHVSLIK